MSLREVLIETYCAERTVERRNAVVDAHRHLCIRGAKKFKRAHNDWSDLEQVAAVGLIKAATNYRAEMQTPFEAYAWIMIVGELMHYVRDHERLVRAPRALLSLEKRYAGAWEALSVANHREPTTGELSSYLGVSLDTVIALRNLRSAGHIPLPEEDSDDGPERVDLLIDVKASLALDERITLALAVDELAERERTIVIGTFGAGLTQSELATRMGLSQSHVSKLLARALDKLRQAA
ncbi:MAG TPA: sigma-70 family RNA polymerase sigma factor [Candidatus Elarobacter sp.]|jgi:RNA polymerase sigma-B factor|nr:sigma-70 family RNA polymerase sigma factor [Candidatus Elarobacter sp.]